MDAAFEADAFEELAVDVPGAHLRLRPHDQSDRVQLYGSVPDADPDTAGALFDRKEISTHHSGDRLHVLGKRLSEDVSDWRWRHGRRTAVRLDVHLPADLALTAQVPGGAVDVANLAGPIEVSVPGGSLHADQIAGPLDVCGSGGRLTVQNTNDAALRLEWGAGPVTLEQLRETSTTLRARSAPTTVRNLSGSANLVVQGASLTVHTLRGPCQAEVHGGSLTYRGAPDRETTLRTVGGPLQAYLPADHPAVLSFTGSQVALDTAFSFEGRRTPHRVEGRLNGGGPSFRGHAAQGAARCDVMQEA